MCPTGVIEKCSNVISSGVYIFPKILDCVVVKILRPFVYVYIVICNGLELAQFPSLIKKAPYVTIVNLVFILE